MQRIPRQPESRGQFPQPPEADQQPATGLTTSDRQFEA